MVPTALVAVLAPAGVLGILLAFTGLRMRSTPLMVAAAAVIITAAGFAFTAIALS